MYVDEIRAYTPQNEQEAADQRLILEYIRLFPDNILTRDNEIAHLSSSGFVVNADGTRVLMAHHNIYRVWAWTGSAKAALQDIRIGLPGMLAQVFAGYAVLRYLLRN